MQLYEFITANAQLITDDWLRRIRHSVAPMSMSAPELLNSLPVFLAETAQALSETLEKGSSRLASEAGLPTKSPIAKEHGHQRLRLGFDVSSIVREYFTLRTCILELAELARRGRVWGAARG